MDSLLGAIKSRLQDGSLNETVAYTDITSSYNPETANYPCVVLSVIAGGSGYEISTVSRATLQIDVYSNTNKRECWTAYNRIKALLHNQESNVSTNTRRVHAIFETSVNDGMYDEESDAWRLVATYDILFSSSSVSIVTAVNGEIYADENDVTADSWKEVAKFRGTVRIDLQYEETERRGQERFSTSTLFSKGWVDIIIEEVMFDPAMLYALWGVTYSSAGTLSDNSTDATTYTITQSTYPRTLQLLLKFTCPGLHTNPLVNDAGGKILEIEASRAVCKSIVVPFAKRDITVSECLFRCYGDASDNIIKVSVEN